MKIHFEQSGGFMAGVKRPPVDIDTGTLPAEEAKTWLDLVNAADFFNIPATVAPGASRDAFSYLVTVESANSHHTVQTHGGTVPPALSPLIERLRLSGHPSRK